MFCDNCGANIQKDSLFCEECGARQQQDDFVMREAGQSVPPSTPPLHTSFIRTNTLLVIIVAMLAIAVITLSVILATRPSESKPQSEVFDENNYESMVQPDSGYADPNDVIVQSYPAATNDNISYINFSGALPPAGSREYDGYQTVDGNPDTCWIVNTDEPGAAGAWIEYHLDETCAVSGIKMINGNVYRDGYYFTNGHIMDFRLDFSDGTSEYFTAQEIESRSTDSNVFYFDQLVCTSYVRLTIISSYIGTKEAYLTNSAMAEFELF